MKICYVSEGTSIHDHRFLFSLASRGHEVHLVSFQKDLPESIAASGVQVHQINSPMLIQIKQTKSSLLNPSNPVLLKRIIDRIRPDVVHSGFLQTYGFCAALANYHPLLSMPWGSDVLVYPKRSFLFSWITKYALSKADMITCDCQHVRKEILRLIGFPEERIVVFPHGVDLAKFNPLTKEEEIRGRLGWRNNVVIIHDRTFEEIYGVEYLIDAIPYIVKEIPDARFLFCGTGSLEEQIKKDVSNRGLSSYVNFAGYVHNDQLSKYLNAADIYVSCSLSDGTSLCLLEAMACGLPVVVTNLPSNREWIIDGENGFLVPLCNSKELARRMIELLRSSQLRREFGERNYSIAKKRADWEKNLDILEKIYEKLLNERT